jgi:hypothetical protein
LDQREDIKLLGDSAPAANLAEQDQIRAKQATAIVAVDTSIREYMQALGALADGTIVQSSSSVSQITQGLTAWQKADPSLGITTNQISVISDFVKSIADLAESGYRNAKLADIIAKSEGPFQQLIALQITIVSRGITPSISEVQNSLNDNKQVLTLIGQDIQTWTKAAKSTKPTALEYANRNPTYGALGAADAHAALYLLTRSFEEDQASLSAQVAAADAYVKALQAIGKAHTALFNNRDNVLTKAMFDQIKPLAQEAYKDFQDLSASQAKTPSH